MIYNFTSNGEFELNPQLAQQIAEIDKPSKDNPRDYNAKRKVATVANANKSDNFLSALQSYTDNADQDEVLEEPIADKFSDFTNDIFQHSAKSDPVIFTDNKIDTKLDFKFAAEHYQNTARLANQNFHIILQAV